VTPPYIVVKKRFPHLSDHPQELISQLVGVLNPNRAIAVANNPVGCAPAEVIFNQKKVNGKLEHVRAVRLPTSRHGARFQFNRDDPAGAVEKIVGFSAQAVATGDEYSIILAARIFVDDLTVRQAAPPAEVPRIEQAKDGQHEKQKDERSYSHIRTARYIRAAAKAIHAEAIPRERRRCARCTPD
jgi:hypothetical protein